MANFFDEVRQLVARNSIEPAILKLVNALQGASDDLGPAIVRSSLGLSRRFFELQLDRVNRTSSPEELERQANRLANDVLSLVDLVESQWGQAPQPATWSSPAIAAYSSGNLPDFREAAMVTNPLRRLAWLERGLEVARAVCKIKTPEKVGTGFIVGGGKLVTNNHVLPTSELAERSFAIFNFEEDLLGRPTPTTAIELDAKTLKTNAAPETDCTIVGLKASPAELGKWGCLELNRNAEIAKTSGVSIIQHPDGGYKQIAVAGNIIERTDQKSLYYVSSTMPGSSGAPVFDDDWKVVALHQGAGVWSNEHSKYLNNRGIRFSTILADRTLAGEFT
jgi:V8-like Glu-specific endopeptidase